MVVFIHHHIRSNDIVLTFGNETPTVKRSDPQRNIWFELIIQRIYTRFVNSIQIAVF